MENATDAGRTFYRHALDILEKEGIGCLVGGAYAMEQYTGIARDTRDFDIFLRLEDCRTALDAFARAGYRTEFTFPHWLGKVFHGEQHYIDLIFASGNALCRVDEFWFRRAVEGRVLGRAVKLVPPEEIIWSKAFIMERERYDGADVMHILRSCGEKLDWEHLLRRFEPHWRVLLSHLILFGFVYPDEKSSVPEWVMQELLRRLHNDFRSRVPRGQVCQGTLLSRAQYLTDVERWSYEDARLSRGYMSREEIDIWTAPIRPALEAEAKRPEAELSEEESLAERYYSGRPAVSAEIGDLK